MLSISCMLLIDKGWHLVDMIIVECNTAAGFQVIAYNYSKVMMQKFTVRSTS